MTIDEMIAVLTAAKAGKAIEWRYIDIPDNWSPCGSNPMWSFRDTDYRVKPDPREWLVYKCADGNIYSGSTACRANPIKVREVL